MAEERGTAVSKSSATTGTPFVIRPRMNRDTAFFWEGTQAGELRLQKCGSCGALRFPPGPACPICHAFDRQYVAAAGTGTVFSYVIHRYPAVPGKQMPILIALIDLDEGVRMVGEVVDLPEADLEIGLQLEVDFRRIDDDLTLPIWRKAS